MNSSAPATSSYTSFFKISAILIAALAVVQAVLGGITIGGNSVREVHGIIGMASIVVAIVAAVAAFLWARQTKSIGTFYHALAIVVLAVAQVALGEMKLETLHITLGVFYLVAALALGTIALRKTRTA